MNSARAPRLDAICRTARALLGVPIAFVSLADEHGDWPRTRCGVSVDGTAGEDAFRSHALLTDGVLVVEDTHRDERFASSPLVTGEPGIRFCAAAPLVLDHDIRIGSLWVGDRAPRAFPEEQRRRLQDLAEVAVAQLWLPRAVAEAREGEERYKALLAATRDALIGVGADGAVTRWNRAAESTFGWSEQEVIGRPLAGLIVPERFRTARLHGLLRHLLRGRRGARTGLDVPVLRRDGTEFTAEVALSAERSGGSTTFNAPLRDITERAQRERALASSEARYRLLADNTTDMIVRADLSSTRLYVSPASRLLLGYEPEELIGTRPLDGVHPEDVEHARRAVTSITSGEASRAVCCQRYRRRDGSWVWVENCYSATYDPVTGELDGYVATVRDVSGRREAEEGLRLSEARLRESERRLALALENGSDGVWDWDAQTGELWFSDHLLGMLGYAPGEVEVSVKTWTSLIHPDDRAAAMGRFYDHLSGRSPLYECEHRLRRKDGGYAWIYARGRVVDRDESGWATRVVGTHIDVTRRKESEARIAHLARHDVLTDLPNRALFRERVTQRLAEIERRGGRCALLYGDLDRFKLVNDTLGHLAGDALLAEVARRLRSVLRRGDTVARLGGDEFAILQVNDDAEPASAAQLARRLIEAASLPVQVGGQTVEVGLSLGIALAPEDGTSCDVLLKRADLALYRAKAEGRNAFRFYEAAMDEAAAAKRRLEMDLRGALWRSEFEVHYQPVVQAGNGQVCGAEALVRWRHPVRGLVPPAEFIPLAEETGLVTQIGAWVLHTACREAASWPGALRLAVNLSAAQLRRAGLVDTVLGALAGSGLPPHRLELEVTESVLMQDGPEVTDVLHRLRDLGVHTSLDDFGTGFSSLSYLRRFPFNRLKVDRSFVHDLANPDTATIVRAIIGLGQGLGMRITAEGVETAEQLAALRDEGCEEVQGYLFSRPLAAEAFRRFLDRTDPAVEAA